VPEAVLHLHPADAARLEVRGGGRARLTGSGGSADLRVALDPSLAPGTAYLPVGLGAAVGDGLRVSVEALP
jgi:anaerobic selenocysteine-containing dehydrogenase